MTTLAHAPRADLHGTARTVVPGAAMIAVSFGLARYGYGLLLPELQDDLAIGPGTAGLISSGAYLSYLGANAGVVWLTARFGARTAIGLAAAFAATGMTTIAVAQGAALLAAGVLVAGAAAGLAFPPYAELVARHVTERRRDVAWSTISSGTGWGVAVAGPIAIAAGENWRLAWCGFVAIAIAVGVLAVRLAPARGAGTDLARPQLSWTWFFCPRSRPLLLSAVLVGTGSAVWWAFSVAALRDAGVGATDARIVYAVCGVSGILASAGGIVFARAGLRTSYLLAVALLAVPLVLLGFAAGNLPTAVVAAVLFGSCYNLVVAAQGIWSARVFAQHPAAGLAAVNTALTIGTLVGPSLAGAVDASAGFTTTLTAAGLVVLVAVFCCPPTERRRRALATHECRATPVRP